jgi:predicted nucleic acid-binding protein
MATHLVDKSAWVRLTRQPVHDRWGTSLSEGRLALTGVGMLEILVSTKSADEFTSIRGALNSMPRVAITERIVDRAMDVQGEMVGRGTHRAPSTADLILAACAEVNGLVVLHYDHDFELISDVTGQPIEWIASAGSIP